MTEEDKLTFKKFYVGCDFAISKEDTANKTAFVVGGRDTTNLTHVQDVRWARMDAMQIIEEFFFLQECYEPEMFFVERGQIWTAIEPILLTEMRERNCWINYTAMTPVKDKKSRGRSFQKRMKAGGVRFNTESSWFLDYREECLLFTGDSEAMADDQFDATAWLFLGMEKMPDTDVEDEVDEDEIEFNNLANSFRRDDGRSKVTGY
jgi:predicted phage terminase large subunit-like protein